MTVGIRPTTSLPPLAIVPAEGVASYDEREELGDAEPAGDDIILDLPTRRLRIGTRFFQAPSAILELDELLRDYPHAQEALQGSARGRALARLLQLAPTPEA